MSEHYSQVGEWIWVYDDGRTRGIPNYMIWAGPQPKKETPPRWCRMPFCQNDTTGEFCATHLAGIDRIEEAG